MAAGSTVPSLDRPAGSFDVVRAALGTVAGKPLVAVPYAALAFLTLLSPNLGNLLTVVPYAFAVTFAYDALGGEPTVDNSLGVRILIAFVATLLAGVAIVVGLVLLVLPGIYLLVRLRLVTAAVFLEDAGPVEALSRSFDLTAGNATTVFGVVVLLGGVGLGAFAAVAVWSGAFAGGQVHPAALETATRYAGALTALALGPVQVAADAVMYGLWGRERSAGSGSREAAHRGVPQ